MVQIFIICLLLGHMFYYGNSYIKTGVIFMQFLYQNRCNIYANIHRKWVLFPALCLAVHNSTSLTPHHSVSRSPELVEPEYIYSFKTPIVWGFLETECGVIRFRSWHYIDYCDIRDYGVISTLVSAVGTDRISLTHLWDSEHFKAYLQG